MKKFLMNFVASLAAYVIISFTWLLFLVLIIMISLQFPQSFIAALVFCGILVLTTGIFAALLFFFGMRLNLLGKHWLNYLSVSGSLFVMLWAVIIGTGDGGYFLALMFIVATFPSIITWLGMLYKSRKVKLAETNG